ncbi:EAL domain-containing protein [Rheinheimera muenzenbergensis]|uniref:EAL domain-containing protein n=1 Tax=Rheinheimera muenzenbergensis TaxID=1193628 RepID=A0ABU8C2C2_9GAMM
MTSELFSRLIVYITEAGVALLLSYLLFHFSRVYQQPYIRFWFLSLLMFALYQLLVIAKWALAAPVVADTLLQFGILLTSYLFALYLLRGMLETRVSDAAMLRLWSGRRLTLLGCMLAVVSVLAFVFGNNMAQWQEYFQTHLRLLVIALLLLTATVIVLYRIGNSVGQRLAAIMMAVWAGVYIVFVVWYLVSAQQQAGIRAILIFKSAELFSLFGLGLALLIWQQEHERTTNLQLAAKTRYLNRYDQLTGALNRDALLLQLQERMAASDSTPVYLLMLGLDKFKTVNESVGLKQGDQVLIQLTKRFESSILKPALVARTGGDIFALVLSDMHTETQLQFAVRHLQQLVEKNFELAVGQLQLTCTIGIACSVSDSNSAEGLLQKANIAFHQAKRIQRQSLAYQAGMEDETARLISWETELLHAMQHNELLLYFQPQLNLRDNTLDAFEVLVRWQHPQKGFLMPGQFLPFVEQLGLSRKLDFWILQQAVDTISRWRQLKVQLPLAVNMSPLHFQQEGLKQHIQQLLLQYQISPEMLELEITENAAMHDMEKGSNHIVELQQMGIRVSIDDFGTGYSSLAYLRRMPIDKIKIDRSFVMDMAGNDSDMMIVKTMITLAHGLGKRILAEGVETAIQQELLKNMSCDAVQGYYIAKPLAEAEALMYFQKQQASLSQ